MRRWTFFALLAGSVLAACCASSEAAPAARRYPPRYTRGTYFPTIVKTRNGQVTTEQVYPGYKNGFPPPAWLYYGYPHSGDGSLSPGF
jgi:hypothetical protein